MWGARFEPQRALQEVPNVLLYGRTSNMPGSFSETMIDFPLSLECRQGPQRSALEKTPPSC